MYVLTEELGKNYAIFLPKRNNRKFEPSPDAWWSSEEGRKCARVLKEIS